MRIGNVVFLRCMQALELELLPGNGRLPGEVRRPERDGMPMLTVLPDVENASDRRGGKSAIAKTSTITVADSYAEPRQGDAGLCFTYTRTRVAMP